MLKNILLVFGGLFALTGIAATPTGIFVGAFYYLSVELPIKEACWEGLFVWGCMMTAFVPAYILIASVAIKESKEYAKVLREFMEKENR